MGDAACCVATFVGMRLDLIASSLSRSFRWGDWEWLIRTNGVHIDRPFASAHPAYPDIRYPLDYGYVRGASSNDGDEVDVFVGKARTGLVGLLVTHDRRKGDHELKLLFDCTPSDVYTAYGFATFAPELMRAVHVLRHPMPEVWDCVEGQAR